MAEALSQEEIKKLARQEAREVLSRSSAFQTMSRSDQMDTYKDMVLANAKRLSEQQLLGKLAQKIKGGGKVDKASDLVEKKRHMNDIGRGVEAFDELTDTVDFPQFVKDLVSGVFDANMSVMKQQTDNYIKLMKEASKSVAQFMKQVNDEDAFGELVDSNDSFNMEFGDEGATLTQKDGTPVDMEDNEVKAAIMDAKLKLAKEHRKSLQQMIKMGITRMVVDKGIIKAGVAFDFKSKTDASFQDKGMNKNSNSSGRHGKAGGGLIGSIFGGPSVGGSNSSRSTSVSVSSAKSSMNDELAAKLTGNVELQFSTDYFELDKFVDLYKIESETEIATTQIKAGGTPPPNRTA
ncbi:MAG: hypothetical protein MK066_13405 [Crocinitomicaceae bacterium]|nr:hypothetical protein [Crocinitomicaceae bacterium]